MKPFLGLIFTLFLAVVLSPAAPFPTAQATNHVPDGLTPADWAAIQSFLPSDYLKASNTGTSDQFGAAVAVSGDTVVVGAPAEDSNATGVNGNQADNSTPNAGAAYVFTRTGGVWSQQAYLKASNTGAGDRFGGGRTVAVSGDTIVVGAWGEDSNATGVNGNQADNSAADSGAAYVFTRTGGVWSQQAYLKASNTGAGDRFGLVVAVSGDTVVVGAYWEDSNATGVNGNQADNSAGSSGAAYVFTRTDGVWSQQAYLKASNTGADDQFGLPVAVSGDTVVVGAQGEDSNATGVNGDQADNSASGSGAAYVFTRTGGVWSQQAYLKASNTEAFDHFGWAVAVSGDTVVVGAYWEDSNATGVNGNQANNSAAAAGAAYLFTRTGGVWSQQAYLKASNTAAEDYFGLAVAVSGDTVVVGTYHEDSNATGVNGNQANNSAADSGAAYVFTRTGGVWSQQAYLKASNTEANDQFAIAVAVSGDSIVVGASLEDSNATGVNGDQSNNSASQAGAVYVFGGCRRSAQSGAWENPATWVGAVAPTSTDGVCIETGHTVTMNGNAAVDQLWVYPGGTLNLQTHTLSVEKSVSNDGTLRQTRAVNNNAVPFLHIQNATQTLTQYRGVVLDASLNGGNNLGNTTVSVRELNSGEYCTNTGAASPAYARRCFDITPTTQPTTGVAVHLYARTADELNGIAPTSLAVYRNNPAGGGTWVEQTTNASTGNDGGAYSYAEGEAVGFSPFLLGQAGQTPTAVSFSNLTTHSPSLRLVVLSLTTVILLLLTGWYWLKR